MEKCGKQPESKVGLGKTGGSLNSDAPPFTPIQTIDKLPDEDDESDPQTKNLAKKLHEANYGSLDERFEAVKEANCDEDASIKTLQRKD